MKLFPVPKTGLIVELMLRDEHCPPHVYVENEALPWEARFVFSFVSDTVSLLDLDPIEDAPAARTIDAIKAAISANLDKCGRTWWDKIGTCCLDRRWMRVTTGEVTVLSKQERGAIQIHTAGFDATANETLTLTLQDGTTLKMNARRGIDP